MVGFAYDKTYLDFGPSKGCCQRGAVAPPLGKKFMPDGEFLTHYCVLMHKKIPIILLKRSTVGNPAHSWGNPWDLD